MIELLYSGTGRWVREAWIASITLNGKFFEIVPSSSETRNETFRSVRRIVDTKLKLAHSCDEIDRTNNKVKSCLTHVSRDIRNTLQLHNPRSFGPHSLKQKTNDHRTVMKLFGKA